MDVEPSDMKMKQDGLLEGADLYVYILSQKINSASIQNVCEMYVWNPMFRYLLFKIPVI